MSAALPVAAVVTGEIRALTLYDECPLDCRAFLVPHDLFAPHLRAGEVAIVDPDDNEPQAGEIYLITVSSPTAPDGIELRLAQLSTAKRLDDPDAGRCCSWWMRFGLAQRVAVRTFMSPEAAARHPARGVLLDGPMNTNGMRHKIVGRVVGVVTGG